MLCRRQGVRSAAKCVDAINARVPAAVRLALTGAPEAAEVVALVEGVEIGFAGNALQAFTESEVTQVRAAALVQDGLQSEKAAAVGLINESGAAFLKEGYYEVNGFRFTEFYYNRLWENGRSSPGFRAESILKGAESVVPDPQGYAGFFRYEYGDWEMIFNPTTKVVSHLSKFKKR